MISDKVLQEKTLVVVGLGNPGTHYKGTRHNAGFELVDLLAEHYRCQLKTDASKTSGCFDLEHRQVYLVKPLTFMNRSGEPLIEFCTQKRLGVEQIIVAHDELDIPVGNVKLKKGGGEAGHNGLKSITSSFKSSDYVRLRLGIGRPEHPDYKISDWVLGKFSSEEKTLFSKSLSLGLEALKKIIEQPNYQEAFLKTQSWLNSNYLT